MGLGLKIGGGLLVAATLVAGMSVAPAAADGMPEGAAAVDLIWQRQLGTSARDVVNHVATDAGGNVVVFGETDGKLGTTHYGQTDLFLARYAANGTRLWLKQLGGVNEDRTLALAIAAGGNIARLAYADAGGVYAWTIAVYRPDGTVRWRHSTVTRQPDFPADLAFTPDGGVVIVGRQGDYVAKYGATGTRLWTRAIALPRFDFSVDRIAVDRSGNIVLLALELISAFDVRLVKLDANGRFLWQKTIGNPPYASEAQRGIDLAIDASGNIVAIGLWNDHDLRSFGFIQKYSSSGSRLWQKLNAPVATAVALDGSGNVLVAANPGDNAAVLTYAGSDGRLVRTRAFGTRAVDAANDIALDPSGNAIVGGITYGNLAASHKGEGDGFVVKLAR